MKKQYKLLLVTIMFLQLQTTHAQTMYSQVYQILQDNCIGCHNNTTALGALNLEGVGNTLEEKEEDVYNSIVGIASDNPHAFSSGYQTIYPGRPDRSFLFRKVNQGLEPTISLHSDAGEPMPANLELTDKEKEMIRQWILIGAPLSEDALDIHQAYIQLIPDLIDEYYDGNGTASFPNGPPPPPLPEEGFQLKLGPFFLNPAGQNYSELEFFQKYEIDLPEDIEITRINADISTSSHHFFILDFLDLSLTDDVLPGFRLNAATGSNYRVLSAQQGSTDVILPEGTAYFMNGKSIFDFDLHSNNYSSTTIFKAEAYVNIYTQPVGEAKQEMLFGFVPNYEIPIPNNGNVITHTQELFSETQSLVIYIWGLSGHTHKWGTGYQIFLRELDGSKGEMIFDGSCPQGIPGCSNPYFDYQHLPIRVFYPFLKIDFSYGLIIEASWINNGPVPLDWGWTLEDEMMVTGAAYTFDTTGLNFNTTSLNELLKPYPTKVFPNPMNEQTTIEIPETFSAVTFTFFNSVGQEVKRVENIYSKTYTFSKGSLESGLYFFRIEDTDGKFSTGKIMIE